VIEKEASDRAVEDDDFELLVGLDRLHDLPEFANEWRTHDIERRIVEGDPPIGRR
jgi:hypothetical protein